ncbi:MAG: YafY family transcriptional regulator [Lachnospiraceae bacterium]|nr:YafY family transcriptional regulator [Lachnospiraceae bacterium]
MLNRLFQIVYLLMEKPQMTAKELADMFEVSERTIYRDIDKLSIAGIPIYTNQGKHGGISILPDYVLNKAVLTTEEKNKIIESLNALNEVSLSAHNDSISKLRSFLGEQYQDWIEIEFSSWGNSIEDATIFEQIKKAILGHCYMEIIYSGNQAGLVERKIKPIKLCFKDQAWYLYAYCCLREDYRFFKLKRISRINVLSDHFEPEMVGKVLKEVRNKYPDNLQSIQVTLEISPEMAFRAYEELRDITVMENGKLLCRIEVNDIDWFTSYVLSYGSKIRVLEPLEMKEKVKQEIEKMKYLYED